MSRFYVGVDLGGTNIRSGLVDDRGNIFQHDHRPTRVSAGRDAIVGGIIASVREAVREGGLPPEELAGIGVGAPGPLDPFEGVIVSPENLPPLKDTPLRAILEEEFGVPVAIDNDANVVAFGEQWMGAGKGVDNFLCVTLGTGVGGGCVSQGRLLRGFNGNAVEIGHTSIDYSGPKCLCGGYGCLELYASSTGMVRRTRERIRSWSGETSLGDSDDLTTEEICRAAQQGDRLALEMFEETGMLLGVGIVNAVHFLNVEVVAFTGGLARAGELIFEPLRRTIQERGLCGVKEYIRIIPVQLGEDAALLGAVRLVMEGGPRRGE